MQTTNTTVVFQKMVRWQISVTFIIVIISFFLAGAHAGFSALLGGLSVVVGAFFASKIAQRSQNKTDATAILLNLLKAEATKILVIVILLFITFKFYKQLVPIALVAGLAGAAIFSGAAMAKLNDQS